MDYESEAEAPMKAESVGDYSGFSESDPPINISDGVLIPEITKLQQPKESQTSNLFSKSQRGYLESLKLEYKETTSQSLRAELTLAAADHLLKCLEKKGIVKKKGEKASFHLVRALILSSPRYPSI